MAESMNNLPDPAGGQIVLYSAPGGDVRVECLLREETIWLTQKAMADLYESQELQPEATLSKMETVRQEGGRQVRRKLDYYNLDAIIAAARETLETVEVIPASLLWKAFAGGL